MTPNDGTERVPGIDPGLVQRTDAALDADTRYLLAMRCGYHPDLLAISLAGMLGREIALIYRRRLATIVERLGAHVVDLSAPHLRRATDQSGRPTVQIDEAAFAFGHLVTFLQQVTQEFVRHSPAVAELRRQVHEDVLAGVLREWLNETSDRGQVLPEEIGRVVAAGVRSGSSCASRVHSSVLEWVDATVTAGLAAADIERFSLEDLERLLGLRAFEPGQAERMLADPTYPADLIASPFSTGAAPIPMNQAGWALMVAIHDAVVGTHWSMAGVPVHQRERRQQYGALRVSLQTDQGTSSGDLWSHVRHLDDLAGDALLVCLAAWTAAGARPDVAVWVTADAILDARGIQRMRRRGEPTDWQHGHRREDRLAAGRALALLDRLWLEVTDFQVLPAGRNRTPRTVSVDSRALVVLERVTERDDEGRPVFLAARVAPGQWANAWAEAGARQFGLLTQRALQYDPYHESVEKWLAKYCAFGFRWNAGRLRMPLTRRVGTLLESIGLAPDPRRPQRTRDRLERALNRLTEDGVIGGWCYSADVGALPARRWLALWLDMMVQVEPPADVVRANARLRLGSGV